jgi:hypothetical protein
MPPGAPPATTPTSTAPAEAGRRRRVRLSVLVLSLLAAGFYFGFIVLTLVRGSR